MRVSVQVFALAEPRLERTLDAYAACTLPEFVSSVRYEACVAPRSRVQAGAGLRGLVASDVASARRHPVFELTSTPPGKLSSRNHAHTAAARSGTDVIVAGDGDAPSASGSYLEEILTPFQLDDVVAVNGFSTPGTLAGWVIQPARVLDLTLRAPLYSRSSAISTDGWNAAGPFRVDSVDQTNNVAVRREEEFAFRDRLETTGQVVDIAGARVYNDNRRYKCSLVRGFSRFGRPMTGYCQRIGADSFHPMDQ